MIKAEYVNHMGSDLTVVNSARVSFNKESFGLDSQDERLIAYLAKHNHFTPFTHPQITLRETVPIFVARQRFKHVVGFTYNEVSRRYVDDTPEFHFPEEWRSRPGGSMKQGSGDTHPDSGMFSSIYSEYIKNAIAVYENMIACGVAPEQARMTLPQSMLTSYYVTGSLAAFARARGLRADSHAQAEIQQLAAQWDEIISPLFPTSWQALTQK
jgi:thymidylate synthase (FAD)